MDEAFDFSPQISLSFCFNPQALRPELVARPDLYQSITGRLQPLMDPGLMCWSSWRKYQTSNRGGKTLPLTSGRWTKCQKTIYGYCPTLLDTQSWAQCYLSTFYRGHKRVGVWYPKSEPCALASFLFWFEAFNSACETRLCFSSLSIFVKRLLFFLFLKYDNLVIKVPMHCNPQQEKVNDRACQNNESL